MEEVGGKTKTIQELLANKKYELDYYQREYSWQTKHVTDLLQDLNSKFSDSYKEGDEPTNVPGYGHYFLGSIIVTNAENKNFIIDGQQRLTTLTLLLIKLFHLLESEDWKGQITPLIFSLKHGKKSFNLDISDREQVMGALYSGEPFEVNDQSESIRNIIDRYNDIEDHFPEKLQGKALTCFVDWLLEKVCFVEIMTKTDDDAYTIFETMNDRGLSLTPTDMLRGYLLSKVSDKERRNLVLKVWDERIKRLKELGKDGESNAIKAWLRSQYTENINDFDKIGSEFHRWLREKHEFLNLFSSANFANFIEHNFAFYTDWYERLQAAGKELKPRFEYVYYNAQHITFHYSFLLAPLCPNDSEEEIIRKIQIVATYLDILIHRRIWNTLPATQNLIADQLFPIIPAIRGKSSSELSNILYKQFDTENQEKISGIEIPSFANNLLRLQGNNRRKIHLILARITDYVAIQSGQSSRLPEYIRKTGKNSYEVEHIWANHPERYTDEFLHEFEFEAYRNRLGGLLLLPKKSNTSYGDTPYAEKHEHYIKENLLAQSFHQKAYENNPGFKQFIEKSGLPFRHHPEFQKKDLDARQKLYQLLAERIWNPERLRLPYGNEPATITIEEIEDDYLTSGQNSRQAVWTTEQIRDLVPLERREYYETQYRNRVSELYKLVADLKNLIQDLKWELTLGFQQYYCAFYLGRTPIFGVTLLGVPRFAVWISEEEAEDWKNHCKFELYHKSQRHVVYPSSTKADILLHIFEFAYKKHQGLSNSRWLSVDDDCAHETGIGLDSLYRNKENADTDEEWTIETVRNLVPLERRESYETKYKNKVVEFYKQVAKLQNFIQVTGWEGVLTLEFHQRFCAFYFGKSPVFGVNLYGPPRFFVRITEEEAIQLENYCEHESYYLQQAIYPHYITLDELYPILEYAYKKLQGY